MAVVFLTLVLVMVVTSQSEPHFQHLDNSLSNNSYIYYANILEGEAALKCVTDSADFCTGANVGVWDDEKRRLSNREKMEPVVCLLLEERE